MAGEPWADAFSGALESGTSLGIEIKCPTNREGISISKNGKRISGVLGSGGNSFCCVLSLKVIHSIIVTNLL